MTSLAATAHRVVTLAGHVDHGKSTLLRALTGMQPDRLPEERLRGRTIELGFLWAELDDVGSRVAFVDVPGHARLVGTMIAGSGVSPAALLVVAADDGPSVQTREHLDILDLLGVPGIAIAITKVDRVDGARAEEVDSHIRALVQGTTFAAAPIVHVVPPTGQGLDRLRQELRSGLAELPQPVDDRSARLWMDRAFSMDGSGTVVTGTLSDGPLRRGDQVSVLPGGGRARIRRLQQLGQDVELARSGTRVAVNLVGIEVGTVRRGDVLVAGEHGPLTSTMDVRVRLLPDEELARTTVLRLHCGTAVRSCRLRPFVADTSAAGGGATRGVDHGLVGRLVLDGALPVRVGDRFILREPGRGRTVGGGVVVDPLVPIRSTVQDRRVRASAVHAAASVLLTTSELPAVQAAWLSVPPLVRSIEELEAWTGGPFHEPTATGSEGAIPAGLVRFGRWVALRSTVLAYEDALADAASGGSDLRAAVAILASLGLSAEAAGALIEHARQAGRVEVEDDRLVAPGSSDALGRERAERSMALVARFDDAGLDPPDLQSVARDLEVGHLERQALVTSGALVRCGDLTLSGRTVEAAIEVLHRLQAETGPFSASQARVALGTTRRVAIPLLEHLVRTGRSRFDGQQHRLVEG